MSATKPCADRVKRQEGLLDAYEGHRITVTRCPANGFWVECSCGMRPRKVGTKRAANVAGLAHHHDVGGCNCPPEVVALPYHPTYSGPGVPAPAAVS